MTGHEYEEALARILAGETAAALESRTLDFKRQGRSRDDTLRDLAAAAACFANGIGGTLVVGVHDRIAGVDALAGTDLDPIRVVQRIYELTQPALTVFSEAIEVSDTRLLLITVPRSPDIHQVDQRATHRVGTSCLPMTATQIASALADRRNDDWSAGDTDLARAEVSPVALDIARTLLRRSSDPVRRRYAAESDGDLLRILGVVNEAGRLNRAGLLLFAEEDGGPGNGSHLVVYQFRKTPAGEPTVVHRITGPLLPALVRILELIDARVDKTPVNLPGGQQVQLADLPEAAVREAVVNALVHRDYRLAGPVQIEHAPTRLVVASPGPLVFGVTVENILTTTSRPRNPLLAGAVRTLGLAEEAGVGVDRMYREMVRVGHQPPRYLEEPDRVTVTLLGGAPNRHLARYVAALPETEQDDADTLLILYHLLTHRVLSAVDAVPLLQKDVVEAQEVLLRLSTEPVAMLESTRETARRRHPNYRLRGSALSALGPAVRYHRGHRDDAERKVIELLQAAGQVNARMVRVALDLDAQATSRLLGGLVDEGVLARISESRRGPSVTYGPGPKLSPRGRRQPRKSPTSEGDPLF
ncbi:putative DNA binding domain-containing protein [Verrucosispora sp. WMMA2044]|uniref:Transcriptional regulator n=1 Tax=Verrucosispora sioxanthis TaxID=2499994 RepID=A0A6M1L2L2_9ACTN|nr:MULTISPECIES: ATP-binding protein [Micromonospora]NEE63527.1 transcriptional regulator [Verrucosispora sioxanthis]NGM12637.1 transcriptional regulator [Verrucosispora sioxanthis]WBB48012.1 putative DNA binding domain-containing protein [Verrucosispora sp. WMMA2044]